IGRMHHESHLREPDDRGEAEQPEPEDEPRAVATVADRPDGDRVRSALVRNHEPGGDVEQAAGPADQREHDEAHAVDGRAHVEVAAEPGADAAEPAAFVDAYEPARLGARGLGGGGRFGHGSSCDVLSEGSGLATPGTIRRIPRRTLRSTR